jgi:hypothetical protein
MGVIITTCYFIQLDNTTKRTHEREREPMSMNS